MVEARDKPGGRAYVYEDAGFTFDSGYYSVPGRWGAMYYESMTPKFTVFAIRRWSDVTATR